MFIRPPAGILAAVIAISTCAPHSPTSDTEETPAKARTQPRHSSLGIRVMRAPAGSCAGVSVIDDRAAREVINGCHGWSISGCNSIVVFHAKGVRIDTAIILIDKDTHSESDLIGVEDILSEALHRYAGNNYDYSQLRLRSTECTRTGVNLRFTGSFIQRGVSGPASPMEGLVVVEDEGHSSATITAG